MTSLYKIPPAQNTAPFDRAPYLSPWYFDKDKPRLTLGSSVLSWTFVEKLKEEYAGLLTLTDQEELLGLIDTNVYVHSSPAGDCFCVWKRGTAHSPNPAIQLFRTSDLQPFEDREAAISTLIKNRSSLPFPLIALLLTPFRLSCLPTKKRLWLSFPSGLKPFLNSCL